MRGFFLGCAVVAALGCGGGSSGGGADGPAVDSTGGGADGGDERDSAPACLSDAPGVTLALAGFQATTIASGTPLVQPVGLAFGLDGRLYIANSTSATDATSGAGTILRLEADGSLTTYASSDLLRGPQGLAFVPGGAVGGPGLLYAGTEDGDEAGIHTSDRLVLIDDGDVATNLDTLEPGKLQLGPGGAFGTDLYWAGRETLSITAPNPGRLVRWNLSLESAPEIVEVVDAPGKGARIGSIGTFTWTAARELWVSTSLDGDFTPGAQLGVWRVDGDLVATRVVTDFTTYDLAGSPDPTGPWGDFVYAAVAGESARLVRIAPDGTYADVATGISPWATTFAPDGTLYAADPIAHTLVAIRPCAQL